MRTPLPPGHWEASSPDFHLIDVQYFWAEILSAKGMSDEGSKEGGLGGGGGGLGGVGGGHEVQTGAQDWQAGHAVHDTSWEPGPFPL